MALGNDTFVAFLCVLTVFVDEYSDSRNGPEHLVFQLIAKRQLDPTEILFGLRGLIHCDENRVLL